jgi:hypothetical protein
MRTMGEPVSFLPMARKFLAQVRLLTLYIRNNFFVFDGREHQTLKWLLDKEINFDLLKRSIALFSLDGKCRERVLARNAA